MASNFSGVPTTPKGFVDKDQYNKDKDPKTVNDKDKTKKDKDPKDRDPKNKSSKRKHSSKDYKIPKKPTVPSPAAFMEIDSSQTHLSTPKRGNKSPSPLNIQSSPGFSEGECENFDQDQNESNYNDDNNNDSDKDQSTSEMIYDSEDESDQRPVEIPRRFTQMLRNKQKLSQNLNHT